MRCGCVRRAIQTGKLHFGYIYGFGACGCLAVFAVLNLMSQEHWADLYRVCSALGYGLLPIVFLALLSLFLNLKYGSHLARSSMRTC